MARLTQRPEVAGVVGAAVFEREDVVDFLRRRVPASREAVLTQGVGGNVGVADFAPAVVVTFVERRVPLVRPVPLVFCTSVSRAEAVVGEFWAAGLGAGAFRFLRHHTHQPSRKCGVTPRRATEDASGGLGLVVNRLLRYGLVWGKSSAFADTFYRVGSQTTRPIQCRRQPPQRPRLLLVRGGAFDVEVVGVA